MPKWSTGDVFHGRYQITRELGRGGFAVVYAAVDLLHQTAVALKLLSPEGADFSHEERIRFEREAGILRSLSNPHCVQLLDFGRTPDALYLVFELLDGETLRAYLARRGGKLEPAEVRKILAQLCDALDEPHRNGVVHRDLKPENVLILRGRDELFCKLLDFGISRAAVGGPSATQTGHLVGTPRYMAPEQLRGSALSPATDVYSLGLIGIELLFGSDRLFGNTPLEQVERMTRDLIDPHESQDAPLSTLLLRMTRLDPAERPQSVGSVRSMLTGRGSPSEPNRKHGHRAGLGVLAALTVLGAVSAAMFLREPAEQRIVPRAIPTGLLVQESKPAKAPQPEEPEESAPEPVTASNGCLQGESPAPLLVLFSGDVEPVGNLAEFGGFDTAASNVRLLALHDPTHQGLSKVAYDMWRDDEDVEWARDKIVKAIDNQCVDPDHVYLFGHSDGARVALPLSCEPFVTATAIHSFGLDRDRDELRYEPCAEPKPLIWMVPMKSRYFSYTNGEKTCSGSPKMPVKDTEALLVAHYKCNGVSKVLTEENGECRRYECDVPLDFCEIDGGRRLHGLPWIPPSPPCPAETGADFPVAATVWDFFESVGER